MEKKKINIGNSDFIEIIRSNYYYVDKTMMIKELIDSGSKALLFTRPRRFGKSLNMSMLKAFFEKNPDTTDLFQDLNIWQCGERYRTEQGKYPVIYLSFMDFSSSDWKSAMDYFKVCISTLYDYFSKSLNLDEFAEGESAYYKAVQLEQANIEQLKVSLKRLTYFITQKCGIKPILLIDEYDKPVQKAQSSGYYNEMIDFMKGFYTGGLKDNMNLTKGILTGVLRIAKESIFTGMNNFDVYSVFSDQYSAYFGFIEEEVQEMAAIYGTLQDMAEIKSWYNGYSYGTDEIYNPWSVLQYYAKGRVAEAYWLSTSGNDIIHIMLQNMPVSMMKDLTDLVQGKHVDATIPLELAYPDIGKAKPGNNLYAMLLMTGYLKKINEKKLGGDERTGQNLKYRCKLMIPNREIMEVYQAEILEYFELYCKPEVSDAIQRAIRMNDVETLQEELSVFLMESTSNFDSAYEVFYHGLIMGSVAMMREGYYVASNLESGEGRFDIQLEPKRNTLPGIVIELKSLKEKYKDSVTRDSHLEKEAERALDQIMKNEYTANLKMRGVKDIFLYGMAFNGKHVKVKSKVLT